MSGQGGIFLDAPRDVVKSSVEWLVKPESESYSALLERALRLAPAMGLATQGGRIGLRSPRAENQAVQRVWQVPHVPADWGPTEVRTVLAAAFEKITLINWRRHDQECTYRFKGTCKMGDRDLVPLVASVADANGATCDLTMWAAIAPTKVAVTTRRTVRREAIPCVELEASILQPKPVKVNVPAELDDSGKEVSPAKAVAAQHREVPKQCLLHPMPRDGACFFHAVARGLKRLSGSKHTEFCHRQLRARVVAHLRKYAAEYIQEWDGLGPALEKFRETASTLEEAFEKYLAAIAGEAAYSSELEAKAISRIYNCCICIIPQDGHFAPMIFRDSQRKRSIVLWHTPNHIDLLLPAKEAEAYQDDLFLPAPGSALRYKVGGDHESLGSGTVWTSARSCGSGTVWTRASAKVKCKPGSATSRGASGMPSADVLKVAKQTLKSKPGPRRAAAPASALNKGTNAAASIVRSGTVPSQPRGGRASAAQPLVFGSGPCSSGKTKAAIAHPPPCASHATAGSTGDAIVGETVAPRIIAKCAYRPALPIPENRLFVCTLCPFQQQVSSDAAFRCLRNNHYCKHHHGQELPGKFQGPKLTVVPKRKAFWRCPLCPLGISRDLRVQISRHVFARLRREHWQREHSHEISREDWAARTHLLPSGPKDIKSHAVASRVRNLQRFAVQAIWDPIPGVTTFLWPRARKNKDGSIQRIMLEHAWRCDRCGACTHIKATRLLHSKGTCLPEKPRVRARRLAHLKLVQSWIRKNTGAPNRDWVLQAAESAAQALTPQPSSNF